MTLTRLEIEDFGLIARASLEFSEGFTVCSGETGSGKTMLLGALGFVLGDRSSAEIVRGGATRARVTLAVEPDAALRARFAQDGFDVDASEAALFVREMAPSGKSTARINGRLATSAQLREYAAALVEQIGQHEAQRLLEHGYQTELLDGFAGDAALRERALVARAFERTGTLERALEESTSDGGRALAELDYARFALGEIDEAALEAGEDTFLRERRDYLANVEKIAAALAAAHESLAGPEGAATDAVGSAAAAIAPVAGFAPALEALATSLLALQSDASDIAVALARELENTEFDSAESETVTARLDRIERLKKKYGGSLDSIVQTRARFAENLAREWTRDEREAALRTELERSREELAGAARRLSELRANAVRGLEARVAAELGGLAMPAARFAVVLEPLDDVGPSGAERVLFALSPNPGEPVRPLARAASGGELSRVLLALIVVLADERERTALVFDEIDAGVGGATAAAVGLRLGTLARGAQVLCVTHLAQIASWADRHYSLRKRVEAGATVIELVALEDRPAVLSEIARMLSGSAAAIALEHAETLVGDVRARKARTKQRA